MNMTVKNDYGIVNARYGRLPSGRIGVFTHRDPKTGDLWCEEIISDPYNLFRGNWFRPENVRLITV